MIVTWLKVKKKKIIYGIKLPCSRMFLKMFFKFFNLIMLAFHWIKINSAAKLSTAMINKFKINSHLS